MCRGYSLQNRTKMGGVLFLVLAVYEVLVGAIQLSSLANQEENTPTKSFAIANIVVGLVFFTSSALLLVSAFRNRYRLLLLPWLGAISVGILIGCVAIVYMFLVLMDIGVSDIDISISIPIRIVVIQLLTIALSYHWVVVHNYYRELKQRGSYERIPVGSW